MACQKAPCKGAFCLLPDQWILLTNFALITATFVTASYRFVVMIAWTVMGVEVVDRPRRLLMAMLTRLPKGPRLLA